MLPKAMRAVNTGAQSETPAISAVSLDCAMKKVSARLYTTLTIRPNTEGSAILK